jgi:hypothetical protein
MCARQRQSVYITFKNTLLNKKPIIHNKKEKKKTTIVYTYTL